MDLPNFGAESPVLTYPGRSGVSIGHTRRNDLPAGSPLRQSQLNRSPEILNESPILAQTWSIHPGYVGTGTARGLGGRRRRSHIRLSLSARFVPIRLRNVGCVLLLKGLPVFYTPDVVPGLRRAYVGHLQTAVCQNNPFVSVSMKIQLCWRQLKMIMMIAMGEQGAEADSAFIGMGVRENGLGSVALAKVSMTGYCYVSDFRLFHRIYLILTCHDSFKSLIVST